jgi:hypothetical protein
MWRGSTPDQIDQKEFAEIIKKIDPEAAAREGIK